jgi:hypothetical protein
MMVLNAFIQMHIYVDFNACSCTPSLSLLPTAPLPRPPLPSPAAGGLPSRLFGSEQTALTNLFSL